VLLLLSATLGVPTNILIAEFLAFLPRGPAANHAFGYRIDTVAGKAGYSFVWNGQPGRGCLAVALTPPFSGTASPSELRTHFAEVFNADDGNPRMGPDFNLWDSRIFGSFGTWPFEVTPAEQRRTVWTAGFPFLAVSGRQSTNRATGTIDGRGVYFADSTDPSRALLLLPIPRGLILGSCLYAALWMLPLVAWPAIRRSLRLRRGHCPRCNYDLNGNLPSGCSECGWNKSVARAASSPPPDR
jgi:hypothetical protein